MLKASLLFLLRLSLKFALGLLLFVALYFILAWLLSRFGIAGEPAATPALTIYIRTNGVHTDIVMPARHPQRDWTTVLPPGNTRGNDGSQAQFLSIGWGDKGFYLETPTWADLKVSTAFKAAFWLGESALHATYYAHIEESKTCKAIAISEAQYSRLLAYIDASFRCKDPQKPVLIVTDAVYGTTDAFYEAKGTYSFLRTCNEWSNDALKAAGLKAARWAPFDWGIFCQYR